MKRRREKRRATGNRSHPREHGDARRDELYIAGLRRFQLGAAAIMFVGLTTATLVCAGEFKQPWLVAGGAVIFLCGLIGYFAAPLAARRWPHRK